jgi:hypothetical protein
MLGAMNSKKTFILIYILIFRLLISIQKYIYFIYNILLESIYTLCPVSQNIFNENVYLYINSSNYVNDLKEINNKGFKENKN